MNVQLQGISLFGTSGIFAGTGLKSTQEKLNRQATRDNQVAFLENQKSNLRNMKCESLDEISRKLEMFHSYDDQIAAVKESYNLSQMHHIMDEAEERAEQIAKEKEEHEPKTDEEKKGEALGTDEGNGLLEELMENSAESTAQMKAEEEEIPEETSESEPEKTVDLTKQTGAVSDVNERIEMEAEARRMQERYSFDRKA